MTLDQVFENYPSPIIAINKNGYVAAKNYIAEIHFDRLHVGAVASRYTDAELDREQMGRCSFFDKEYTYFTLFRNIDGEEVVLLFLSLATFGEDLLPYSIFEVYKEKISALQNENVGNKNKERQYIRAIHNNMIKANYFEDVAKIFDFKKESQTLGNDTVSLSRVCSAVKTICANYLSEISIDVDIDYISGPMIAQMREIDISGLMINSLAFCVINSADSITIKLEESNGFANVSFSFKATNSFESWMDRSNNALLNASLSLTVALELAKSNNLEYKIFKRCANEHTLLYKIPIETTRDIVFSSSDTLTKVVEEQLLSVFFNQ